MKYANGNGAILTRRKINQGVLCVVFTLNFEGKYLIDHLKVMLKAKVVQILFLQIHQYHAKYTFETFTVDGITIAYQIESIA